MKTIATIALLAALQINHGSATGREKEVKFSKSCLAGKIQGKESARALLERELKTTH
jgi:hypothetical protein